MVIQWYKTNEVSKILCIERHLIKNLREEGVLTGRKQETVGCSMKKN